MDIDDDDDIGVHSLAKHSMSECEAALMHARRHRSMAGLYTSGITTFWLVSSFDVYRYLSPREASDHLLLNLVWILYSRVRVDTGYKSTDLNLSRYFLGERSAVVWHRSNRYSGSKRIVYMYQNIFQRHLRRGEQRTFSNLEAKEYLIHSGTINSTFEFRSKFK